MIVKTKLVGGYVWIEHDDSVGLEGRIYSLCTEAPGHPSFSMGTALARAVGQRLVMLTRTPEKTDYEALDWHWADRNRRTFNTVGNDEFTVTDHGPRSTPPGRVWPTTFTFRASDGALIKVDRRIKAWWLLRKTGVALPPR